MKAEQYKIDYYSEMLSIAFEQAGVYNNWLSLSGEQQTNIVETIIGGVDQQSMHFGYVDTVGDSHEVYELKKRLVAAEKEAEQWRNGFVENVSRRHPSLET